LGGFEDAFKLIHTNPDLFGLVVKELAIRKIPYIESAAEFNPDGILLTAFLEGTDLVSPGFWREQIKPGHKLMVKESKKHGMKTLLWFLGGCLPLLEDFIDLGIDALVVEQSRCAYSSDPGEIREIIGDRICLFGWSPEMAMINNNRREITRTVEHQIKSAGLDGSFAMGTTFLTGETDPETVNFYCDEIVRSNRQFLLVCFYLYRKYSLSNLVNISRYYWI